MLNKQADILTTDKGSDKLLDLIFEIAVAINSSPDTSSLLETILDKCLTLTNATSGSVVLYDPEDKILNIVAYRGLNKKIAEKTRLKVGEGVTGWVAKHIKPLIVNDTSIEPKYISVRKDILSEIAVPIVNKDRLIGIINMDSNKKDAFTEVHKEFLLKVAELTAQIFIKDEIQEQLQSKINSQNILINAFEILEKTENLESSFQAIMEQMNEKMGIIRGILALFDPSSSGVLKVYTGFRINNETMNKGIYKIGEGIIGIAVKEGRTITIKDINKEPRFLNKMKIQRKGQGIISFIASPVKIDNEILGVLAVEKKFNKLEYLKDVEDTLTILASILAYRIKKTQKIREQTMKLISENLELRQALQKDHRPVSIIGKNPEILKIIEQIELVANTNASVLITGSTGTGKELVARALHNLSSRKLGPFISINCSAVPENLLESELFGSVKGAFTGSTSHKGKFELADGGTLFLDEIGDMPLPLQAKILRCIEEKEVQPLGSEHSIKVDIRIVAATNKDLSSMITKGLFRSDLFFRLNVINIHLPSLVERKDDIILLTDHFIRKFNKLYQKNIQGIDKETETLFMSYPWPGNIRELENAIERAVILCRSPLIDTTLLPDQIRNFSSTGKKEQNSLKLWLKEKILEIEPGKIFDKITEQLERLLIQEIYIKNNYNKLKTASELGINRNTLTEKLKKYGLN